MKKVFLITQFGKPHEWTQQYIDHVQHLEKYGWYWKIFTPNPLQSKGNVEIVPMTTNQFNDLVRVKLGIPCNLFVNERGVPCYHVTDLYIFSGVLFEDYIKDADFWGITNFDVVYGRLDHFLPDERLQKCDIFSDDVRTVNGVFSLWRNTPVVNNLFRRIANWDSMVGQFPCKGCESGDESDHRLFGTDEIIMTEIVKRAENAKEIIYDYPEYYPMLSHDRLQHHKPKPNLDIKKDGSLWELFYDTLHNDQYVHSRPVIGKEIMYFHFSSTKIWPIFV